MREMSHAEVAWVAGIVEGEGSFCKKAHGGIVKVAMTDLDVLQRIHTSTGTGLIRGPYRTDVPRHKPIWHWTITKCDDILDFLDVIEPFMCDRRRGQVVTLRTHLLPLQEKMNSCLVRGTGVCRHGHDRAVVGVNADGRCAECNRLRVRSWRSAHA